MSRGRWQATFAALFLLVACGGGRTATGPVTNETRAREFVDLLTTEQYAGAVARFDGAMTVALPADKLQGVWRAVLGKVGPFLTVAGTRSEQMDGHEVVFVTCQFAKGALDAQLAFDRDHLIAGLYFVPPRPSASSVTSNDSF